MSAHTDNLLSIWKQVPEFSNNVSCKMIKKKKYHHVTEPSREDPQSHSSLVATANIEDKNSFTHIHNPLLLLIHRLTVSLTFTTLCCCSCTDQWMGRNMHTSSGQIDHATIAQFRQGDFVDQTQHVKKERTKY